MRLDLVVAHDPDDVAVGLRAGLVDCPAELCLGVGQGGQGGQGGRGEEKEALPSVMCKKCHFAEAIREPRASSSPLLASCSVDE
eukprot:2051558-Rhodomonas_salina.1